MLVGIVRKTIGHRLCKILILLHKRYDLSATQWQQHQPRQQQQVDTLKRTILQQQPMLNRILALKVPLLPTLMQLPFLRLLHHLLNHIKTKPLSQNAPVLVAHRRLTAIVANHLAPGCADGEFPVDTADEDESGAQGEEGEGGRHGDGGGC